MEDRKSERGSSIDGEHIIHVDILDGSSMVLTFSNGAAARLDLEKLKQFALREATEIIPADGNDAESSFDS